MYLCNHIMWALKKIIIHYVNTIFKILSLFDKYSYYFLLVF